MPFLPWQHNTSVPLRVSKNSEVGDLAEMQLSSNADTMEVNRKRAVIELVNFIRRYLISIVNKYKVRLSFKVLVVLVYGILLTIPVTIATSITSYHFYTSNWLPGYTGIGIITTNNRHLLIIKFSQYTAL